MLIKNKTLSKSQKITSIKEFQAITKLKTVSDSIIVDNFSINKTPLVKRKIIKEDKDINQFFDEISMRIFPNSPVSHSFSKLLQSGYISLSSNAYADLENPKSAIGVKLNSKKTSIQNCARLEEYIKEGIGVGINFSEFQYPIEQIKDINKYFKYREPNLNRPPAGIALLNINHAKIIDFIKLKDNADYKNWCFDLSVVMDDEFLKKVDNNEKILLSDGNQISAGKIYFELLNSMMKSGEPGVIFSNNPNFICDSCAASELKENEGLNLAQINLSKFYNMKTKSIDYVFLSQSANILSSALKNIAPNGFIGILGYQDLLNKMNLKYGSKEALEVLEKCLQTIKKQALTNDIRMAISPCGTTFRILNTTPSIEPYGNKNTTYWSEIDTMIAAQKYLEGGISKTITLKKHHDIQDLNLIIRYCKSNNIKGISVFPYDKICHTQL